MAASKRSTSRKANIMAMLTKGESSVVSMYRAIQAEWDRRAILIVLRAMAEGRMTDKTNRMSWPQVRRTIF